MRRRALKRIAAAVGALVALGLAGRYLRELDRRAGLALQDQAQALQARAAAAEAAATERSDGAVVIHFDRGVAPHVLGAGWSVAEPGIGVWSAAPASTLTLGELPPGRAADVAITLRPFIAPGLPAQHLRIRSGPVLLADLTLTDPGPQTLHVAIPKERQSPPGAATLTFETPDADSPARHLTGAHDPRPLGVMLKTVSVGR